MIQPIQSGELANRLILLSGIQRPYYAIQNPRIDANGRLSAVIEQDLIAQGEHTIISAATAAQHLAVLGTCCLALQLPSMPRQYFMVRKATLQRGEHMPVMLRNQLPYPGCLNVEAVVLHVDMRLKTGEAQSFVYTPDRHLIFQMKISFRWVTVKTYERLFRLKRIPESPLEDASTINRNIPILIHEFSRNGLSGSLGPVEPSWCAGHFNHFPNLPMSAMGNVLSRMAAMHLKLILKNHQLVYSVKKAITNVRQPAFAGEKVLIHSSYVNGEQGDYTFLTRAVNESGDEFGNIMFTFTIHQSVSVSSSEEMHYFPVRPKRRGEDNRTIMD